MYSFTQLIDMHHQPNIFGQGRRVANNILYVEKYWP